ncbi:class E sortase [Streptomyces sp. NPDC002055]|uniref:class E sortase n=1 Tax=Streptomyces sp. NPDC002055 TaxID=3154534 RepID=UPI003325A18B
MRGRVPVVVRGQRRGSARLLLARGLWGAAETAVTLGVLVLLLVAHQLWWTNRQAREGAERQVRALEREWARGPAADGAGADTAGTGPAAASGPEETDREETDREETRTPGRAEAGRGTPGRPAAGRPRAPRWDQAYAVLRIPRIGVTVPVAEGTGKAGVLNRGYVGHYPRTARPGEAGNFALAGHRNTHGEPFRRLDRLRAGDRVTVETAEARYAYVIEKTLPQTSARDSAVLGAVPRSSVHPGRGYREPGYYLTLTTCTPEYTSRYRLVVWGRLASVRVRGAE